MNPESLRKLCISSYASFCLLMQDEGWFDDSHKRLCDWIQYHIQSAKPEEDIRLNIVMPRGTLKSTIVTKYLSAWLTLQDSNIRILIATNTIPNARKKIEDIRGLYDGHEIFRALFPELLPKKNHRWTNEVAEINRKQNFPEGTFECAGMKTKKTGTHYNVIIEDDTVAPSDSDLGQETTLPSTEDLERSIGWHKAATPLLVPKGTRIRIVVTTRWSDDDLVDYIRQKESYKVFDISAQDSDGKSNFTMLYTEAKLAEIAELVGPYMFSCLYLNKPLDANLRVFQREWFQYYTVPPVPEPEDKFFHTIAIDPAISEKKEACETAITQVYHHLSKEHEAKSWDTKQYWSAAIHGRFNPHETIIKALDLAEKDPDQLRCIIIESNAYQASLKYYIREEMIKRGVNFSILPVVSRSSKDIRIEGMVPYFASKRIWLSRSLPSAVETQLIQYPHGKLVDIIDAFSLHRSISPAEKRIKIPKKKDVPDPLSWEEAYKELKKRHDCKTLGVLAPRKELDYGLGIPTGLGMDVDTRFNMQMFKENVG